MTYSICLAKHFIEYYSIWYFIIKITDKNIEVVTASDLAFIPNNGSWGRNTQITALHNYM